MAVTNYYSINGVITGEEVLGGSRTDYLTDALGSVVATVNQSAQVVNTYRYKPYGSLLAQTGGGSDPSFQWVGSPGYRHTGKSYSEVYIRARHYSSTLGRWTMQDPLWPEESAYAYSGANPISAADPAGLQQSTNCRGNPPVEIPTIRCYTPNPRAPFPPSPTCQPSGGFVAPRPPRRGRRGRVPAPPRAPSLPKNWWDKCIGPGVRRHCSGAPFEERTLMLIVRCILWGETRDRNLPGEDKKRPHKPWGPMQLFNYWWNETCKALGYPKWKTDPCQNIQCGIYVLCSCLRKKKNNWIVSRCGYYGDEAFQAIENPEDPGGYCACMRGCGMVRP